MNQNEIKAELERLDAAREICERKMTALTCAVDEYRNMVTALKAQLAEAENAGLTHGDYGIGPAGPWTRVHGSTWWDTKDCTGPSNQDADVFIPYRLGNIFDDLKARQEPLKEFKTEYAGETTEWSLSPQCKDLIFFIDKKIWIVRHQNIPKLILNLQRLVNTAGQEAAH